MKQFGRQDSRNNRSGTVDVAPFLGQSGGSCKAGIDFFHRPDHAVECLAHRWMSPCHDQSRPTPIPDGSQTGLNVGKLSGYLSLGREGRCNVKTSTFEWTDLASIQT
jgi:hypothetical protein